MSETPSSAGPLPPTWRGPWIQVACFCERAILDNEGILTIVRVVDRITVNLPEGVQGPVILPPIYLVLTMKAGDAIGRGVISVRQQDAAGVYQQAQPFHVLFESPDRGNNLVLTVPVPYQMEGLHWFDVSYEGQLLTRLPLRVVRAPAPPVQIR